jgi:phage-related protein
MGFLDFLKKVGGGIMSGIGKVAGIVGKIAPVVSGIAGAIPTPFTQGLAQAANVVGGVANGINGAGGNVGQTIQNVAGAVQGTPIGGVANQVAGVANAVQGAVGGLPAGAPVMQHYKFFFPHKGPTVEGHRVLHQIATNASVEKLKKSSHLLMTI